MSIHNKNLSLVISLLLLISHYLIAQNVTISNKNNPNEPSIMLNPKNPSQMIAASNLNNYFINDKFLLLRKGKKAFRIITK